MADERARQCSYLTVQEVASRLNVSRMTVYRLVHAGEMKAVRLGRSFRVSEPDVEEYLQNAVVHAEH